MPAAMTHCRACHGALEAGFLVDRGDMNLLTEASWASGPPRRSLWQVSAIGKGERHLPISTFRCTTCGLLELYALEARP